MDSLLQTARTRNLSLLVERLEAASRSIHRYKGRETDSEQLIDEALWYARHGDIDEATLRLERRSEPKFRSVEDCETAYAKAMSEKHVRACV